MAAAIKAAADRLELQVILAAQGPEKRGSRVQSQNARVAGRGSLASPWGGGGGGLGLE
jgi:hypothetical protein